MELNPRRSAVIVIHCQGDVVAPDGAFAGFFRSEIESRGTLEVIGRVLEWARAKDIQIVYTRVAFAPDYSDMHANSQLLAVTKEMGSLKDGSKLADIVDELAPRAGDEVVTHQRVGGFSNTRLHALLQERDIDTLLLAGVATTASVETTARYASDLGYRTIIIEDGTSAATPEAQAASIASLALLAEIVTSWDLADDLPETVDAV